MHVRGARCTGGRLACAGARLCDRLDARARGCARGRAAVRGWTRECAATGALFTREHDLHPK
ncbi:hypothetical protein CRG98_048690 [Punica granatum]|uniref:Uncharacterized protein n=1 Tax=Punica granatum TaxID=22663 RepID=A0A2I0HGU5_PUNGR|nr:hypothetical protein CRG98_048690 [Punica granatum]